MLAPLLLATPWMAILALLAWRVRLPREVPEPRPGSGPPVSVVVPARNEAANIGVCVASLVASRYPDFEVIVVDDRSEDGTGALARAAGPGRARRFEVLEGEELPPGWLGKPWACWQGARAAGGALLLFTDADTVHGPELLGRAVAALEEDAADLVTLAGRQRMETFWERMVQPHIFMTMLFRFHDVERWVRRGRWRDAIANGQFLLFRREAYDALGGHEVLKGEVVEDLAFAQRTVRRGLRLSLRTAEPHLVTRMYRSLSELIEGWTKNIVNGAVQSMPPALRPFVAPGAILTSFALWLGPPLALTAALVGAGGPALLIWSATAVGLSLVIWTAFTLRMGTPFWYGLLYPIGAVVVVYVFLRAWTRGRRVEWKGRSYTLGDLPEVP